MIYELQIDSRVEKDILKIPKKDAARIITRIEALCEDPYPPGSRKIKYSKEDLYRVRQGNYRILYVVEEIIKIIEIREVGHRRDIYQK